MSVVPALSAPFDFAHPDYPLAPLTLYHVGGPARLALLPASREEALAACQWMGEQSVPKCVLGGGSNVLVADQGFPGIVLITTAMNALTPLGEHRYDVDCGVVLDRLVQEVMLANNYAGAGGLTGVPGSVGGAIYMNAGTVKGTTCELMESADVVIDGARHTIPVTPESYGYRGQRFCPKGGLILGGIFQFEYASEDQRAIYNHYIQRRKEKQPQGYSCGSVFKNPDGGHAGQLIEACGLKGTRHGGAVISPMHANFIMNENHATAADIRALIALCKARVLDEHGIELHEEVVYVG